MTLNTTLDARPLHAPRFNRVLRSAVVATTASLAAAGLVMIATPAVAHDGVIESTPADGSTVSTELTEVSMRFSDELLDLGGGGVFIIQVTGPDERFYNVDCVTVNADVASTEVSLGETGEYVVNWQVISSDGHPTSDTFSFNYEKPDDVVAAPGLEAQTCNPGGGPADESAAQSEPILTSSAVLVAGGILVLLLALVAGVVALRYQRKKSAES
jgi:methionine-rich copper-binding protein CopC